MEKLEKSQNIPVGSGFKEKLDSCFSSMLRFTQSNTRNAVLALGLILTPVAAQAEQSKVPVNDSSQNTVTDENVLIDCKQIPQEKINNRKIVLDTVQKNPLALKCASDELKNDRKVVLAAVMRNGKALEYVSDELRNDKTVVLLSVIQDGHMLLYASDELKNDKEVVLAAVRQSGSVLVYASKELRNDKEIVLAAVKTKGRSLLFASKELKNDKEVVLAAVKSYPSILKHASKELQNDAEVILIYELTKRHLENLSHLENLRKKYDSEVMKTKDLVDLLRL